MAAQTDGLNLSSGLVLGLGDTPFVDYQFVRALTYAAFGGASVGEVVRVAQRMRAQGSGRQAWVEAWREQAEACRRLGEADLAAGRRRSAGHSLLRAYNYYRSAEFFFDRHGEGAAPHRALYEASVDCFEAGMAAWDAPMEKLAIPYERSISLPGYFFKAAADTTPRPTIIINGGGDSFGEESYFTGGAPEALARGFNVLVFHGPGQRGVVHAHPQEVFRTDHEVPLGRVIDYVLARPDVDPDRLGLYGYSFGGHLAPRAAAHDGRIKALCANAPIADVAALIRPLALASEAMKAQDWSLQPLIENAMLWNSGTATIEGYLDYLGQFRLTPDLIGKIACPTLCIFAEGEGPGARAQAMAVYEALRCKTTWMELETRFGADSHCGLNNVAYASGLIYDWFAETLGA